MQENNMILKVSEAIEKATGKPVEYYNNEGRTEYQFYLRLIFIHNCLKEGLHPQALAEFLNRTKGTIISCKNKFHDEICNKQFKFIVDKVREELEIIRI